MYQQWYQRFLQAHQGEQHFACHSHYYWPDVTRDAMLQYWDDSARYVDDKWSYFFSTLIPELQQGIADILNLPAPQQLVFAPNTHEYVMRLLSCLPSHKRSKIITTDSEFHSFTRQSQRLEEAGQLECIRVPTQPFATFQQRFMECIHQHRDGLDMVFFSQVFFNSGFCVPHLADIVAEVPADVPVVIDGYHGFMAIPTDLSALANRIFYLGGGYKYAQAGEGACFMSVPMGCELRPVYTGWFAELATLGQPRSDSVQYATDGMRFAGATMDFAALYRLRAVLSLWQSAGMTVPKAHAYIKHLQQAFLQHIAPLQHPLIQRDRLLVQDLTACGHFLTFQLPSAAVTATLAAQLRQHGIHTDYRADRLRFGFALYHLAEQYDLRVLEALAITTK